MKTKTTKTLFGIVVAGLVFGASAFAAPLNLSVFEGNYKGTTTVTGPNGTETKRTGLTFAVPDHGRSAQYTIEFTDIIISSYSFKANKRVLVSDLLLGIAGANNAKRGKGPWTQSQRTLRFSATNGEGTTLRGKATVRDLSNRRLLTLTMTTSDGVDSTTFKSTLRARLP